MPGDTAGKKYSYGELQALARSAGFTGNDVNIAAAVALAESGGDSRSYNPVGLDDSYGLWQINMKGDLGPDRRKKFGISKNSDLFDPGTNAKAAKRIKDDSGWKAWTTYTSRKYVKFLNGASATPESGDTPVSESVDDGSLVGGIKASINGFSENVFKVGANFVGVLVGVVLLVLGVVLLARKPISEFVPAKALGKTVGKVLKK